MIERDAFERFYGETVPRLERLVARLAGSRPLAEEVVQEAYYRFLRSGFSGSSDDERRRYLYRIAINLLKSEWAREKRHRQRPAAEPEAAPSAESPTEVSSLLDRMKPKDRALLWLAYAEGYSHREVGEAIGVGAGSVRVLLHRARRRFLELMKGRS